MNTGLSPASSNDAGPYRDEKAPDQKIWGFFVNDWLMHFSTEEITSKQ